MLDAKRIAKLYERFSKKADKYNDYYLLYLAALDDVEPTINQKWKGYDDND